jgi:hypothetical protein
MFDLSTSNNARHSTSPLALIRAGVSALRTRAANVVDPFLPPDDAIQVGGRLALRPPRAVGGSLDAPDGQGDPETWGGPPLGCGR